MSDQSSSTTGSRYLENDAVPCRRLATNAHDELLASLTRINAYNPPVQTCSTGWTFHGLYSGPTSIAYLFFRLGRQYYPGLVFKGQSLLDWAQAYLDLGATFLERGRRHDDNSGVDPNHCGIANEILAQLALRAAMDQDGSLAQRLCSVQKIINDASAENGGSDEWLYGRSGYLYLLRLARSGFDSTSRTADMIDSTIEKTVQRVLRAQQPWTWHGKAYVGAAHGTFGILGQLVLSSPSIAQSPSVQELLSGLLDTQFPATGNFPSSLPPGSDRLVQFCHGAPGAVLALRSLRPHFPHLHDRIDLAIAAAQRATWKRGLLAKQPCLCHGIAGNSLALDDSDQIEHFLSYMTSDALPQNDPWMDGAGRADDFVGLYTGEAGRAWAWAVADRPEELGRVCIGFNDL
jgi:hypothetical protein